MLPVISMRLHGVIDYIIALALILYPWIDEFDADSTGPWILMLTGVCVTVYSFFTQYEKNSHKFIPIKTHLWFDLILGAFLAASPWLFHFRQHIYLPHVIAGLALIGLSVFTRVKSKSRISSSLPTAG